jgi:hypothetical protein
MSYTTYECLERQNVRIFKNKWFVKFALKQNISNTALRQAIEEIEAGKIDADLGGGVIKQRIARPGKGKSGGYRTIILYKQGDKAFFVYGFAKNDQENITELEEKYFKELAAETFAFSEDKIEKLIRTGVYREVYDGQE